MVYTRLQIKYSNQTPEHYYLSFIQVYEFPGLCVCMQTLYPEYDQKEDRSHDWESKVHEKAGSVQCISQQASVMFASEVHS